ncbi:NADH dehydrogenase-like protein YutJ [Halobacillus andaensis]|uniref:NADH dehydrogenase-like protein YutJ n=1 Tax=Halobacillus andaensis TaxID=1176239 RepID=A0A917B5I5_HALAA|nr:NAD(P)/FAD-dependent oxidoreductase [Halobacillus andaensis]MBP2005859.1 NADH dehydrogenase [Halobacillus andaensis]GGF25529.1 NADH dehydrogenase-like protein YutJ [Halobacillus andaensis]
MKRLVILGGGYGGLKALLTLIDQGMPKDVHITVIDRNPYHSLKTEFYTIAAGTEADKNVRMEFPKHEQVHYVYTEINKIDIEDEQILIKDFKEAIPYDYLIIGLGCEDNYHGIEGAKEFTESVQTFEKARSAGFSVGNLKAYGKVTVVGAGLSGIEVASEIRESRPDLNIRLLDRGETVLRAFDKKIQDYVEEWFASNDVEVLHKASVDYVEKDGVCNNGICYLNDVTIWTAGVRPNYLVRELPFEKDEQDKVIINDFYQVPERQNVYVVGDCASSTFSPSAQLAGQQGEQIGEILADLLNDKEPSKPKEIKLKGTLGSLGKSDGFGNMMQQPVTGRLPRLAKSGVLWLNKRH